MPDRAFLTAQEATAILGITPATLYSYVSRGMIYSEPTGPGARSRRYRAADVSALQRKRDRRRNPATVAASALDFGEPVQDSGITLIRDGRVYYRGHSAVALAGESTFEAVAHLLWDGMLDPDIFHQAVPLAAPLLALRDIAETPPLSDCPPLERLQALLPLVEQSDLGAHDPSAMSVMRTGVRLLHFTAQVICGAPAGPALAPSLAAHWHAHHPAATRLIDASLILAADHEFNVSAFTARCVASTGATPYAAVGAALAALQGPRHGGHTLRCESFLREAERDGRRAVLNHLKQGEALPGFGHRLYPHGDPRGCYLVHAALTAVPEAPVSALVADLVEEVERSFDLRPNLDLGLVTMARLLDLPPGSALLLFALGRIAGWIGHILEQYGTGQLIRPRARYTGPDPLPPGKQS